MDKNFRHSIQVLSLLGSRLLRIAEVLKMDHSPSLSEPERAVVDAALGAHKHHAWFTREAITAALESHGRNLQEEQLLKWLEAYPGLWGKARSSKKILLVMAGNIPLVWFHDLISIWAAGHHCLGKMASADPMLPMALWKLIRDTSPPWGRMLVFCKDLPAADTFDAVIATGSNNTTRYFRHQYGHLPHIIRGNRHGVAVLSGRESLEELHALGKDVFDYFGLGCRNVSLLCIPESFDPALLQKAWKNFAKVWDHKPYQNNYQLQKALMSLNGTPCTDLGYCLLTEDTRMGSPLSVIHLFRYRDVAQAIRFIEARRQQIQCVVSARPLPIQDMCIVKPGSSQRPLLWDYADGADTMAFLSSL